MKSIPQAAPERTAPLAGKAPAAKVVNTVVDSCDVRILEYQVPSAWLLEQVEEWRRYREEWKPGQKPLVVDVPGLGAFTVVPDRRPYEFALVNPQLCVVRIWNPNKWVTSWETKTGQLYISFRSKLLQLGGKAAAEAVIARVEEVLLDGNRFSEMGFRRVVRGDISADVQLRSDLGWADVPRWVCRARKREQVTTPYGVDEVKTVRSVFERFLAEVGSALPLDNKQGAIPDGLGAVKGVATKLAAYFERDPLFCTGELTWVQAQANPETFYFGRFGSELYARVYNKLLSIFVQDKLYMLDIWRKGGWDGESPVWRIEFSLSGDYLKGMCELATGQVDIREWEDFWGNLEGLWSYLTREWLTHRHVPRGRKDARKHCDEWNLSQFWKTIQGAWAGGAGVVRVGKLPNPDVEQLAAQIKGCLVTFAALTGGEVEGLGGDLVGKLQTWVGTRDWQESVIERRRELGRDPMSDTFLSAQLRREMICELGGS